MTELFDGERAGRCIADRAKASLFSHCCDVFTFFVQAIFELIPDLVSWLIAVSILAVFPVSIPVLAFLRRRRCRIMMAEFQNSERHAND